MEERYCQCSPGCIAIVKTSGKLYARGHSPVSHSEERNQKAKETIRRVNADGSVKRLYGSDNPASRPDVIEKISAALKGRPKSEAHKLALSIARKGSTKCLEASRTNLKKAIEAWSGSHHSEEFKQHMSQVMSKTRETKHWDSWSKGKKLHYPVWNKGLTKETDLRVAKQAEMTKFQWQYSREKMVKALKTAWGVAQDRKQMFVQYMHDRRTDNSRPWNVTPTEDEQTMLQLLKKLGLTFKFQYFIIAWTVDFFLPDHKVVIECDGKNHQYENRIIEKDQRENEALKNDGYKVLRISSRELRSNLTAVRTKIEDVIGKETL